MIDVLDHLTIAGSTAVYEELLGRRAIDGRLQTGNVGLLFGAGSDALSSMAFATASLDKAARLLERRAVPSERRGDRLILSRGATHGVPIDLCERTDRAAVSPLAGSDEAASISALDHIVVRTPNPERAIAFYAGRLGLDLRLDRSFGRLVLQRRCFTGKRNDGIHWTLPASWNIGKYIRTTMTPIKSPITVMNKGSIKRVTMATHRPISSS